MVVLAYVEAAGTALVAAAEGSPSCGVVRSQLPRDASVHRVRAFRHMDLGSYSSSNGGVEVEAVGVGDTRPF